MKSFVVAAALAVSFVLPAFAEDTTVVREHHESPGVKVGVPGVGVKVGGSDCSSKTVHKEDGAGDSKTVHSTNC